MHWEDWKIYMWVKKRETLWGKNVCSSVYAEDKEHLTIEKIDRIIVDRQYCTWRNMRSRSIHIFSLIYHINPHIYVELAFGVNHLSWVLPPSVSDMPPALPQFCPILLSLPPPPYHSPPHFGLHCWNCARIWLMFELHSYSIFPMMVSMVYPLVGGLVGLSLCWLTWQDTILSHR